MRRKASTADRDAAEHTGQLTDFFAGNSLGGAVGAAWRRLSVCGGLTSGRVSMGGAEVATFMDRLDPRESKLPVHHYCS